MSGEDNQLKMEQILRLHYYCKNVIGMVSFYLYKIIGETGE
jgi:hypothetical protein